MIVRLARFIDSERMVGDGEVSTEPDRRAKPKDYIRWQDRTILSGRIDYNQQGGEKGVCIGSGTALRRFPNRFTPELKLPSGYFIKKKPPLKMPESAREL